jgi:hypothetical protein
MKPRISSNNVSASRASSPAGVRFWTLLALFVLLGVPDALAEISREYQLKAVFLFNFAQFTDWPPGAFADEKAPIILGVLGNDPFGTTLSDTIKDETVQGHPLRVEHYRRAEDIKTCHILFISQSETRHAEEVVSRLKGKPTLTVADAEGPATKEVMIRFIVENNKVHFRINQQAAASANLTLSSRLLRVAETPPERAP